MSTDSADEDNDSDDDERPFMFNSDHCLHVFNALKHGYGLHNNSSANNNYVNLSHQNRAEYLRHLELIDLQLDLPKLAAYNMALNNLNGKKKRSDTSDSNDPGQVPQTLREIFKISNTNRKKNK